LSRLFCFLLSCVMKTFQLSPVYSFGGFFFLSARWQRVSRVTWSSLADQLMIGLVVGPHIFLTLNTVHEKTKII
jgi:hypothetical protein